MTENVNSSSLVFLADDDDNDCFLFRDALEQVEKNVSLKTFKDGFEMMNYLNEKRNQLPDLIFLDLIMPYKNGFDCLEEIRASERLKNLIVIIYSTASHIDNIQKALNKGGTLYFAKSSTFQELVDRLKRILKMDWQEFNPGTSLEKFVFLDDVAF